MFRLHATGRVLTVDGGHLTLMTAGLNSVTMIVGFAIFAAVRRTLAFDRRLVFTGPEGHLDHRQDSGHCRHRRGVAAYAALVLLAFWRPSPAGWAPILAAFTAIALAYWALGLLGLLVQNDLEGFFLIIMGGLMDTFLQNPLGNPLARKPILEWFPSFGHAVRRRRVSGPHRLVGHLALGLVWPVAFAGAGAGLIIYRMRTRTRARSR